MLRILLEVNILVMCLLQIPSSIIVFNGNLCSVPEKVIETGPKHVLLSTKTMCGRVVPFQSGSSMNWLVFVRQKLLGRRVLQAEIQLSRFFWCKHCSVVQSTDSAKCKSVSYSLRVQEKANIDSWFANFQAIGKRRFAGSVNTTNERPIVKFLYIIIFVLKLNHEQCADVPWITASRFHLKRNSTSHAHTFHFMQRSANIIRFSLFNLWGNVEHFPFI